MARHRKYVPPQTKEELDDLAERLLDAAECRDVLPTPLDQIAGIKNLELVTDEESVFDYMNRLTRRARNAFSAAREKLRGAADLRHRVIFVPHNTNRTSVRARFAAGHEIAHQFIEWHYVVPHGYLDDDRTLSKQIVEEFEQEANYLSAGLIYQGREFVAKTRSVKPTISAILEFAAMHDASIMATAWQFISASDEAVAVAFYYPSDTTLGIGSPTFKLWRVVPSARFERSLGSDVMPAVLPGHHEIIGLAVDGTPDEYQDMPVQIDGQTLRIQVQAYWNSYSLIVLFRRPPIVRKVLNRLRTRLN